MRTVDIAFIAGLAALLVFFVSYVLVLDTGNRRERFHSWLKDTPTGRMCVLVLSVVLTALLLFYALASSRRFLRWVSAPHMESQSSSEY